MAKAIDVVFENGVFKPFKKINLPQHKKFRIILENTIESITTKKCSLDGIIDIAKDCSDSDLSIHHDKYLYGEVLD